MGLCAWSASSVLSTMYEPGQGGTLGVPGVDENFDSAGPEEDLLALHAVACSRIIGRRAAAVVAEIMLRGSVAM